MTHTAVHSEFVSMGFNRKRRVSFPTTSIRWWLSGKLLSVTLFRGKRTFTFFLTDEVPTLTLIFQNEFNVSDTLYLTAQTKRKVSFDRSFAVCCGKSSAYDDNTEIEYESETSSLSYSFARHLTQAFQSHKLYLISPELPVGQFHSYY